MSQDTAPLEAHHSPLREVAEQVRNLWWVPLAAGLVSAGLGLAILATGWTVAGLVVTAGLIFIIRGIALAFSPAYAGRTAGEHIVAGLAAVIAGIVLIAWPGPTLLVLAFFAGAWLTVSGAFHIITTYSRRRELPHWGFTFAVGVVEVLLGVWAMRRPEASLALLVTVLGLWAVLTGIIYCVLAFEIRRANQALSATADGPRREAA
ncbi:MAG: HdeD family acid-resistance protein [Gemmatimonadota bacterium]